jgi:hypothetical protein
VVIAAVFVVYFLIVLIASILLIRAVKKRDHTNMMMFMILMAVGVIISFIQIFVFSYYGVFFALINAAFNTYVFLCIYSLYDKFRNERLGRTAHGQTPGTQTVVYMQPPQYGNQQAQFGNQQAQFGIPQAQYGNQMPPVAVQPPQTYQYPQQPPLYTQQEFIQSISTSGDSQSATTAVADPIPQKTVL